MGWNLTCSRQRCVAAVLILAIGLSAYGCADSASVNPVVELSSLTVTPGTLQPAFAGETTQYTVDLTSDVTSVRITAQPAVAGDTVKINDQPTTSSIITLNPAGSSTQVSIVVSESGTNSRTYTVLLKRAGLAGNNSLVSLTVSQGTLVPSPFDANLLSYRVDVANDVGTFAVTPTLSDSAAKMTVNEALAISGQSSTVSLNDPGQSTSISIVVTAPNGNQKTYLVIVNRGGLSSNNFLESLTVSSGTSNLSLDPRFSEGNTLYTINVATAVSSVTVKPTLKDATASMSIGVNSGQPTNISNGESRIITLGQPDSNTLINIIVTAANGDSNPYVIVVDRAPSSNNNLSALTVTSSTWDPNNPFNPSTTSYTVNVATDVTHVTVSATKSDPNAVLSGTVPDPGPGQATGQSLPIQLNGAGGEPTRLSVDVIAQSGGAPKTYTITVNRAAPAAPLAPTSAPDLIPEDDSCLRNPVTNECEPGTSNEDNRTNVTTPKFKIPQPPAGEIPSLYINGDRVQDAIFAPATNTFTLTTPLIDRTHRITSTVTNMATTLESFESPFLDVIIDTAPPGSP